MLAAREVGWGRGLDVLKIVSSLFYRPNLNAQMDRWGLIDSGFDYNLVAVFGSQSTGKSSWLATSLKVINSILMLRSYFSIIGTLLNRLFGTNFDVMDETRRQQTTKGMYAFTLDL